MRSTIILSFLLGSLAVACSSSGGGTPDGGVYTPTDSGQTQPPPHKDSGAPHKDAGMKDTGAPVDAGHDTAPSDASDAGPCGGSVIPAMISTNLTLTKACSPWHLTGPSIVGGTTSPILTIEAGVTVVAEPSVGAGLEIGMSSTGAAGLNAVGTMAAPIIFTSSKATPAAGDWGGVVLGASARSDSQLTYVQINYGGAMLAASAPASLTIGEGTNQAVAIPLSNVTVANNLAVGILLTGSKVGFGTGSGTLSIPDWGNGTAPIVMNANQASTLSGVSFTAGPNAVVQLNCDDNCASGQAIVSVTQTWPSLTVPYLVYGQGAGVQIEGQGSTGHATLTIASGSILEFTNQGNGAPTGILVDPNSTGQADLQATDVLFTSASASPTEGSWGGIYFNMTSAGLPNSSLTGCTIKYAGGDATLSSGLSDGTMGNNVMCSGAVYINNGGGATTGPTIGTCTIQNFASTNAIVVYNVMQGMDQTNEASYTLSNTFEPSTSGLCTLN